MKKLILSLAVALIGVLSFGQNMVLHLNNLPSSGNLMIGVVTSEQDWESKNFVASQSYIVSGNESSQDAYFELPENKEYGVAIFVDINNNYQFDYGSEYYGFSNGFIPMGPPMYDNFKFMLQGTHEENISLRK